MSALTCRRLPDVSVSRLTGLLEVVHDEGDAVDTAHVAMDLNLEFDELLPAIEAAELLGFAKIKSGKITLTAQGKKMIAGDLASRRRVFKRQLSRVKIFKELLALLRKKKRVKKRALIKYCWQKLPRAESEKMVARLIDWGRHAEAIGFDSEKEELYKL
ncbi:MAG: AAA-associated domain-containing protein [Candidatus Norongarragalinales archaeon]